MVLSLPFVLAFIGSATGLLVGMLIFGDITEAIECPASGGGGGGPIVGPTTSYSNLGTLGSVVDATYAEAETPSNFVSVTGILNEGVIQNGTSSLQTNGEIYLGSTASTWDFLPILGVGSNTISINIWVKGDLTGATVYPILTTYPHQSIAGKSGMDLVIYGGSTRLAITENGIQVSKQELFTIPPNDGNWHMITATYDKSITSGNVNLQVCVDNSCVQNDPVTSSWTGVGTNFDKLTIGSDDDHVGGGGVETTWQVDEVAIWNGYLLSAGDITSLYNSGAGLAASSISSGNLRGYWSFDDSTANGAGGGGGDPETGSEQCQQAKDISWTVIGIIPVALFFSLFAIFSALGTGRQ